MDVHEPARLKEIVDRRAQGVADAGDRTKCIRARPQVGDLAKEFEAVPFFLQGIFLGIGRAINRQLAGVHFDRLTFGRRSLEFPDDADAAAGGKGLQELLISGNGFVNDHLQVGHRAAVVEFDKGETLL